jgi:photosystem II stability/assembly factor-like uncharacterized protein
MNRNGIRGGAVLACLSLALLGCTASSDLSAIKSERLKPVQRYDIAQSLAANGQSIVAGTQSGVALVSLDQGQHWTRTPLGPVSLIGLTTCPDGTYLGIDFYHKVWTADVKGGNWQSVALEKPRVPLAVTCDSKGQWWVTGSGTKIAKSADKGKSWQVTDLGEDAQFTTLQFIDDFGIAMGEFGMVVTSHDGGGSWKQGAKIANDFYPYATLMQSKSEGWTSGIAGQLLHTTDGGATWQKGENATHAPLYRLFMHDGQLYGAGAGGVVARLDKGVWHAMPYPDAQPMFLGAAASLNSKDSAIAIGGPGGLLRVVGTKNN